MADLSDITLRISAEYGDVNKAVNATNSLERKVRNLAKAFVGGQIPQNQFESGLRDIGRTLSKYSSSYQKAHYDVRQLGQEYVKAEKSQREFVQSQMAATKKSNRMGVATQQLGYQVSDFVVQIQSGTNAFVAFGQQASQLVGVLPLVADKLGLTAMKAIGISSALGVIIPVVTLFGATWLNTRNDSEKAIKGIEEKISGLGAALDRIAGVKLKGFSEAMLSEVDKVATGFETLLEVMKAVEAQNIKQMLNAIIDPFKDALIEFETAKELQERVGGKVSPEKEAKIFKPLGVKTEEDALYVARQLAKLQGESREELGKQLKIATENIRQRGLLTVGVGKTISALARELGIQEQHTEALRVRVTEGRKISDSVKVRGALEAAFFKKTQDRIAEEKRLEQDRLRIKSALSAKFYELTQQAEKELQAEYDRGIIQRFKSEAALMDQEVQIHQDVKDAIKQRADEAAAALKKVIDDFERTAVIIDVRFQAETDVMQQDFFRGAAPQKKYKYEELLAMGVSPEQLKAMGYKPTKKPKTPAESMASIIKGMEEQANLQRQIVGLSDQEADYLQILYNLKEQNKTASGKMTEAQLKQAADRIAAINAETAAMEAQMQKVQDVADSIESNFGDALMGIVTDFDILNSSIEDFGYHAEQVFKNMAREIIKELYRIFVVKKITGFVEGAITGTYADLGRVGAPSMDGGGYTGSGPRSGGLDGKGGFLAMLHPRETVIDHTKGQSGGVTVQQNFNFSANGDESVKRMIAQAAPQIAKMTERGIMDSRRRGGQMKAVFG